MSLNAQFMHRLMVGFCAKTIDQMSIAPHASAFLLFFIIDFLAVILQASPDYSISSWQSEDGLPQNSISCITQTRDGYLWAGTYNGLVRFDGIKFTVFTTANTPNMTSDNINALLEDDEGTLWIATEGGGLMKMRDGAMMKFAPVAYDAVECLALDNKCRLLAGTRNAILRIGKNAVETFSFTNSIGTTVWITSIAVTATGEIWGNTPHHLCSVGPRGLEFSSLFKESKCVCNGIDGNVWVGSADLGLVRISADSQTNYPGISDSLTRCIYQARNGDLWIGHSEKGITRMRHGQLSQYSMKDGLNSNMILCIYEDKEGNIWIGTNGGGLSRLRENMVQTYSTMNGLPGNDVVTLLRDNQGKIWIGTYGQGLIVFDQSRFSHINGLPGPNMDAIGLCQTRSGSILIGAPGGKVHTYTQGVVATENLEGVEGGRVIFEDREGGLWLGSSEGGVEHRTGNKTNVYSIRNGLSHNHTTAILQDSKGAIWVGTKNGLNCIDAGKITTYSVINGLKVSTIHTLYFDHRGLLWIGTAGGGLSRYQAGVIKTITSQQGLINDVIGQIIEDDDGFLWLGSNTGLCRVKLQELEECLEGRVNSISRMVLTRADGLINNEFAGSFQPSCFKDPDGKLWFSTVGGIVVVDPKKFAQGATQPILHIEKITCDRKEPMQITGNGPSSVNIQPGIQRIEIQYTGLNFSAPQNIHFKCKLEGFDADWLDVGTRRTVYYTGLAPGRYCFRVNGCGSNGIWNPTDVIIGLFVHPFFWQTLAFKLACLGILAGASAALAIYLTVKKHHRDLELAERKSEQRRTEELKVAYHHLQNRTSELEEAMRNVRTLSGLIPMCASCKKIRDDKGYWNRVEKYIQDHTDAIFSHGICPECARKLYGQFFPPSTDSEGSDT